MKRIARARAPLRLGLAGGGTDISSYCDIYGGYVLNATIDRYAYAVIRVLDEPVVRFHASDRQQTVAVGLQAAIMLDGALDLHKAVYNYMILNFNDGKSIPIEMTTFCDAPPGSGLGSSSTLVVAMIKAFIELLNVYLDDYAIAQLAFHIERVECGLQGGRQDQYSATFGGFNFIEFYKNGRTLVNTLRIKEWIRCELESSIVLYYTGTSRESANIIDDQTTNIQSGDVGSLEAMHGLKREALETKESLLRGDFSSFSESLLRGWKNKKRTAGGVSNTEIDSIYQAAISSGALAGKVSGAGGGGFLWFLIPAEKRMCVIRCLNRFGGQVSNCHFTREGAQAWSPT